MYLKYKTLMMHINNNAKYNSNNAVKYILH